jgi:hypothetical protein
MPNVDQKLESELIKRGAIFSLGDMDFFNASGISLVAGAKKLSLGGPEWVSFSIDAISYMRATAQKGVPALLFSHIGDGESSQLWLLSFPQQGIPPQRLLRIRNSDERCDLPLQCFPVGYILDNLDSHLTI